MDKTLSLIKDYLNIIWAMEHNLGYNLEDFDEKNYQNHCSTRKTCKHSGGRLDEYT